MKICIRADGGSEIGMGHIMRMTALANELRKNNEVFFACRVDEPISDKYIPGIEFVKSNNFRVIEIREDKIYEDIKNIEADCIISDSYDVDEEYFNVLKENFKVSGYMDDEKICNFFNVDFLINQNLYADIFDYKVNNDTKMFLGSEFIILRNEFQTNIKNKLIREEIKDIMITVGGSDYKNITEEIITKLINTEYILHIVVGSGFNNVDNLKKYESDKIKLYMNADMRLLMEKCDICITGCGSTVYELCVCKTPFIGIEIAENQHILADYIEKNNISSVSNIKDIRKKLEELDYKKRKEISRKLESLVDGNGVFRITNEINRILEGKRER